MVLNNYMPQDKEQAKIMLERLEDEKQLLDQTSKKVFTIPFSLLLVFLQIIIDYLIFANELINLGFRLAVIVVSAVIIFEYTFAFIIYRINQTPKTQKIVYISFFILLSFWILNTGIAFGDDDILLIFDKIGYGGFIVSSIILYAVSGILGYYYGLVNTAVKIKSIKYKKANRIAMQIAGCVGGAGAPILYFLIKNRIFGSLGSFLFAFLLFIFALFFFSMSFILIAKDYLYKIIENYVTSNNYKR